MLRKSIALVLSLLILAVGGLAESEKQAPTDAKSLEQGRKIFSRSCARCHGPAGKGDGPFGKTLDPPPRNLIDDPLRFGDSDEAIFNTLTKGIEGSPMRGWETRMTEKNRWQVVAYVQSLRKAGCEPPKEEY